MRWLKYKREVELCQRFERGQINQNIMKDFKALWGQGSKVVVRGVQTLPGFGDFAACGRSDFKRRQHGDGHGWNAVCYEACVVGIVTGQTEPAAICRGLQESCGALLEGTEIFYEAGGCFWRKDCLRKDRNVAATHTVEHKDVII